MIRFGEEQRAAVAAGLQSAIAETPFTCWACAVLRDHVHLVIRKHRERAEAMIEQLQQATRNELNRQALAPDGHPVWTLGGWKAFLDSPQRVRTCVAYVNANPMKEGLPPQAWPFVVAYDGWPFGRGG